MHFKKVILKTAEGVLEESDTSGLLVDQMGVHSLILTRNEKVLKKVMIIEMEMSVHILKNKKEGDSTELGGSLAMKNKKEKAKMNATLNT